MRELQPQCVIIIKYVYIEYFDIRHSNLRIYVLQKKTGLVNVGAVELHILMFLVSLIMASLNCVFYKELTRRV